MAGTALATQIITAVDAYIAGVTPPVGENLVRQDLFEALFGAVEDWVGIQDSGQSVSANTTLTKDSPRTTKITTGATDMTVTLPVGSTCRDGQRFRVFKVDSGTGNVSFARQSTDTINGVASLTLLHSQYSYIEVEWMGSGLWAITPGGPEYGTNSNGEYIVFSNGLQVCMVYTTKTALPVNVASGGWYRNSGGIYTGTWPSAFKPGTIPWAIGTTRESSAPVVTFRGAMSATIWDLLVFRGTSTASVTHNAWLIAIGWAG